LPEVQPPNEKEAQTSGYGLFLIHSLMDEVRYHPWPQKNHWQLMKRLRD
jgi:anti-sigma regulatory factor (Ser/Thr protein kinase)